ncbi:MAG: glycosyltransferase family 4 protein [Acidimicrobiales bacterium]
MRIAMVSPYDLGIPGGVQGQVTGLSRALRALGHDVMVVAPGPPQASTHVVTVGRSIGVRANGSVAPIAISPIAAIRAARAVRRPRIDVVHLHEPFAPAINYGCLLAARHPMVGTFHRNGSSSLYRTLGPAVRWTLRRLSARTAVSEAARDNLGTAAEGVEVLFNGVEVERFQTAAPRSTTGPTVLFVGRHEPRKGLATLLDAFARLEAPAVLWVAGAGPQTDELRRVHPESDRLRWLGTISEDEKVSRMAGADVLCAPSTGGESFGMVLLEAMAAGCALVASDIDGYRSAAGGLARLVPPADPPALAAALGETLRDAAEGRGLSAPGAKAATLARAARWSMAALAAHYVEIYERAIADHSA